MLGGQGPVQEPSLFLLLPLQLWMNRTAWPPFRSGPLIWPSSAPSRLNEFGQITELF